MRESFPPSVPPSPNARFDHQSSDTRIMGTPKLGMQRSRVIDLDEVRRNNGTVNRILSQWEREQATKRTPLVPIKHPNRSTPEEREGIPATLDRGFDEVDRQKVVYVDSNPFKAHRLERMNPSRQRELEQLDHQLEELDEMFLARIEQILLETPKKSKELAGATIQGWLETRPRWKQALAIFTGYVYAELDSLALSYRDLMSKRRALRIRPGGDL